MGNEGATTYTWTTRELPILQSALRRVDGGEMNPDLEDIRTEIGLAVDQMNIAVDTLEQADYLELRRTFSGPNHVGGRVLRVLERTRRELGSWPSAEGLLDELTDALTLAASTETEPERKARLRAALDVLTGTGRKIVVDVLSGYVEKRLP